MNVAPWPGPGFRGDLAPRTRDCQGRSVKSETIAAGFRCEAVAEQLVHVPGWMPPPESETAIRTQSAVSVLTPIRIRRVKALCWTIDSMAFFSRLSMTCSSLPSPNRWSALLDRQLDVNLVFAQGFRVQLEHIVDQLLEVDLLPEGNLAGHRLAGR